MDLFKTSQSYDAITKRQNPMSIYCQQSGSERVFFGKFGVVLRNKKSPSFPKGLVFLGGRSVSNRRPPEPQSGALTN